MNVEATLVLRVMYVSGVLVLGVVTVVVSEIKQVLC